MSHSTKKDARLRRAKKTRVKLQNEIRLCVHRSSKHIYAQVIDGKAAKVLAHASTLDKEINIEGYSGNMKAAAKVGEMIAKRAKEAGVTKLAFDRSGNRYHGRVKSLADAAREAGLEF